MEKERIREAAMKKKNGFSRLVRIWCILFVIAVVGLGLCGGAFLIKKNKKSNLCTATVNVYIHRPNGTLQAQQISISNALPNDYLKLVTMKSTLTDVQKAVCAEMDKAGEDSSALANLSIKEFQSMVSTKYDAEKRLIEISVTTEDELSSRVLVDAIAKISVATFNDVLLGGLPYAEYDGNVEVKTLTWGEVWSRAKQGDSTDRKATE